MTLQRYSEGVGGGHGSCVKVSELIRWRRTQVRAYSLRHGGTSQWQVAAVHQRYLLTAVRAHTASYADLHPASYPACVHQVCCHLVTNRFAVVINLFIYLLIN